MDSNWPSTPLIEDGGYLPQRFDAMRVIEQNSLMVANDKVRYSQYNISLKSCVVKGSLCKLFGRTDAVTELLE